MLTVNHSKFFLNNIKKLIYLIVILIFMFMEQLVKISWQLFAS